MRTRREASALQDLVKRAGKNRLVPAKLILSAFPMLGGVLKNTGWAKLLPGQCNKVMLWDPSDRAGFYRLGFGHWPEDMKFPDNVNLCRAVVLMDVINGVQIANLSASQQLNNAASLLSGAGR